MSDNLACLVKRLEVAVSSMEKIIGTGTSTSEEPVQQTKPQNVSVPPLVSTFESRILSRFPALLEIAGKIDPQIVNLVYFT